MILNSISGGGGSAVPADLLLEWVQALYPDFPDGSSSKETLRKALDYVDENAPCQFAAAMSDVDNSYGYAEYGERIDLQGIAAVTRSCHIMSAALVVEGQTETLQFLEHPGWTKEDGEGTVTLTYAPGNQITRGELMDAIGRVVVTADEQTLVNISLKGTDRDGKEWTAEGSSRLLFAAQTWAATMGWGYTWQELADKCGTWEGVNHLGKPPAPA